MPFWTADAGRPPVTPTLVGATTADLAVVGGGYTGLWTALLAKEADPGVDVVVLEGREVGWAASGRNGGFCESSLTHGFGNGHARFEPELAQLLQLGWENLDAIEATLARYGIDAEFERTGELAVATAPWQVADLRDAPEVEARYGGKVEFLDKEAVQAEVHSPVFEAGLLDRDGCALVHPAKLAWGLKAACQQLGVRFYENSQVTGLTSDAAGVDLTTPYGSVRAPRVALATNVFPSLVRRVRPYVVPVWDYVLMTEPLTAEQQDSIGWKNRQGIGDAANQFHYYRPTADGRILWGGYDAVYYYGNGMDARHEHNAESLRARWPTTSSRPSPSSTDCASPTAGAGPSTRARGSRAFWGTAHRGRVAYVARLHRPRGGGDPVRRAGHARPPARPRHRADPAADGAHASRSRSRRSRSRRRGSTSPVGPSTGPIATRADATPGCGPSTGSASASTPERPCGLDGLSGESLISRQTAA